LERDTMIVVMASRVLVLSIGIAACGRIGFDPTTLSCIGSAPTCGPAGTSDCCASLLVPGGMFYRGYDVATDGMYPDMTNPATVSDFRLDTYEVTVGRFRKFVDAGMGTQANPPLTGAGARTLNGMAAQGGWDPAWNASLFADKATLVAGLKCNVNWETWTDTAGASESLPINCISWFDAFAFCAWDGGFLPTDTEWNYAAVGGGEQRAFPWSKPASSIAIDCSDANFVFNGNTACVSTTNTVGSESPTGDGKYGQADLSGNVWEWTLDWYSPYANPCNDCADLTAASNRVVHGGYFQDGLLFNLRAAHRNGSDAPAHRGHELGVRCARAP
jgi:formylglycine-generating enzyme required for sulfatase activity